MEDSDLGVTGLEMLVKGYLTRSKYSNVSQYETNLVVIDKQQFLKFPSCIFLRRVLLL